MTSDVNPAERVRLRVVQRLSELRWTKRELGQKMGGKGDAWAGAVWKGKIKFQLKDLDELARVLKMPVAALVKRDDDEAEFLSPSERRLLRAVRALPVPVRDHLIVLADYLVGVMPEEIELLSLYRTLTDEERQRLNHAAQVLKMSQHVERHSARAPETPPATSGPPSTGERRLRRQK